ncbi:TPA: phage tail protein [Methanosarcinaceae archaeon]|nr:phage tail protein [Methanosarcinaceae archaeon]
MGLGEFLNLGGDGSPRIFGVVVALVTDNKDEEEQGRVKIKFPWMGDEAGEAWARLATLMGGKDRGMVFYPEVDDEVLVVFEQGNINYPYVIGALWNGKDKPPEKNSDGKNNIKMIKSRSGHTIIIDDKEGKEKIEIIDKSKKNKICIDSSKKKISMECEGDIELSAAKGKVSIKAKEIEIKSSSSAKIEASAGMDLKASGIMKIKGSMVNIN